MENNRLNGIALQYIHREINLAISEIIDRFAGKGGRRIDLKYMCLRPFFNWLSQNIWI